MAYFRCIGQGSKEPTTKDIAYLKWQITKTRDIPAAQALQVSEFYLYQNTEKYEWNANVSISSNMAGETGQEISKLIDSDIYTKYCTTLWGSSQTNECNIIISLGETITISDTSAYSFVTGGDETTRDPISWNLYGSIDGIKWEKIDSRNDVNITTSRNVETYPYQMSKLIKGADILSGIVDPISSLGSNGKIYLKYADYNSLYDFKEYIEVGSTQGAYINTGLRFTYGSEFEIDCQWTDTPTNTNGYAFGAWTSNQDTFVGFQNGNTFNYAVGGVHNNTAGDFQRHVFKATHTKMYIDGVEQINSPNWSSVSSAPIGIFIISNNTSYLTNNCKVYYIKMWDNNSLVHYFVPVERKSDNEAGMLDIITGIFYDNDGTQSFTVGGTPSITFDYPITQTYAKINSTWQNLIGTDVRKIMSGQKPNFVSVGTFVTGSTTNFETEVYCGFKPDYIHVEMEFGNGHTYADYYRSNNYVYSWWDLRPIENTRYNILNGEDATAGANGETGITRTMNSGFAYRAHGDNTFNKSCTYYAVKMSNEGNINPIVFKNYAKFNGTGIVLPFEINSDYKVTCEFYEDTYYDYSTIIGDTYTASQSSVHLSLANNYFYIGNGSGVGVDTAIASWISGNHKIIINNGSNKCVLDNTTESNFTPTSLIGYYYTIGCKVNDFTQPYYSYIKSYKIESISTGDMICELLPCLVYNSACMFDIVNEKIYTPKGLTVMDEIP